MTDTIYNGKNVIVPLADVQHIETHNALGLIVITKHTRWDGHLSGWANNIWIDKAEAKDFLDAWWSYRHELDGLLPKNLRSPYNE